jgi:KDO2-lipid IV(A) lauroyltransferase
MIALLVYHAADALVRVLPVRWADAVTVAIARLAFVSGLPHRRHLETNLARLMRRRGRAVRHKAREAFINFGLMFTDFLRLGHLRRDRLARLVEVRGLDHLEQARRSGRGVILLSAHLGNWELGVAYLALHGTPVHVVARPHSNRGIERFFAARRRAWGIRELPERPLWRGAADALRRHEWVALMADRGARSDDAARTGSVAQWAAVLARRTGALVLPGVIVRERAGRYVAYFDRPLEPDDARIDQSVESLRRYLREFPGQWFAFEPLPRGLA